MLPLSGSGSKFFAKISIEGKAGKEDVMEPLILTPWLELDMVVRLIVSIMAGGLIGWERERRDKPAGFRTHILVAMGSTLFTILSIYAFGGNYDPSRVAAGIVLGVGFLGAGTIIRGDGGRVVGLTTAASVWVVAAIGMAIGTGFYLLGIVATALVFIVLLLLTKLENLGK
jgi:putative Mg2+ transporter-C (MgtC) family protein